MRLLECTHACGICRKREKRKMEESLRKVKTLGQAEEDIDDLAKWVTKSRSRAEEEKELAREEALAAAARRQAEQVRPTCNCVVLHHGGLFTLIADQLQMLFSCSLQQSLHTHSACIMSSIKAVCLKI